MITDRLRTEAGLMTHTERLRYLCELLADHLQQSPAGMTRDIAECALRLLRQCYQR